MIDSLLNKGHRNPLCFDSVKDLEAYTGSQMEIDDVVSLLGVVSVGDGLGHQRIIKDTDDGTGILLTNGRYANIIPNSKLSDKANKAVQIVAGMGIKGGGTLGDSAINLSVESANDGLVVNSDSLELATVNNLKDSSTTKPLSAAMGQKLGDEKVNFTDIVNDFITGGTNKVASAETVKILKQIIDTMGEGGVAKLAAQLKSSEKSRIPSTGTLPAGGSVMVASSGLVIDPRVYVNGELVPPSGYTIDYNAATITLTEPVKYSAVFFIDDTYAPKFKFSVSTVNFLVNAPTLKEKLSLGDVIDIQGESDAYDGGHHVRVVENTSKLNGVDLGGGLFLNEVPNSRYHGVLQTIVPNDTLRSICSKTIYDNIYSYMINVKYKTIDSSKVGWFMRIIPKGNIRTRSVYTLRFNAIGGSRNPFVQDIKVSRGWGNEFKVIYVEPVYTDTISTMHCASLQYVPETESIKDIMMKLVRCDSTGVALFNELGLSVDFDIEYLDTLPDSDYNVIDVGQNKTTVSNQTLISRGKLSGQHDLNTLTTMSTYNYQSAKGVPANAPTVQYAAYGGAIEIIDCDTYIVQKCTIVVGAIVEKRFIRLFDAKWGPWKEL